MDFCDVGKAQEEKQLEVSIANARNQKPVLIPKGKCYNCSEDLTDTDTQQACFCDWYCRDDWEARQHKRLRK